VNGSDFKRPESRHIDVLKRASSASITTILKRRGVIHTGIPLKPIVPGYDRVVGPAVTLRSVPGREDIAPLAYQPDTVWPGHPDDAIEALQPGDVLVHDGLGLTHQGLFGDLLVFRVKRRGAAGLVTWMCIRDLPHMPERELPIFALGSISHGGTVYNVDYNVPINCAGTLVIPGDVVVGDGDGVAVIPAAMVPDVCEDVIYHEEREVFLRKLLDEGAPLKGTYPPSEETDRKFRAWRDEMRAAGRAIL
jgi:regulator of RNase E activity RraA